MYRFVFSKPRPRRRAILLIISILSATHCSGGGGGGNDGLSLLLLGAAASGLLTSANAEPRFELRTYNLNVSGSTLTNFYGAGLNGNRAQLIPISVGATSPAAILQIEQAHLGAPNRWLDFQLFDGSSLHLSRNAPSLFTLGTIMHPYGSNGFHYTSPGRFLSNFTDTQFSIYPVSPATGLPITAYSVRSLIPATAEEKSFVADTSTSNYKLRGMSRTWSTRKRLRVHIIFVDGANANATPAGFQTALDTMAARYAQATVAIDLQFSSTSVTNPGLLDVTNLNDESGTLAGSLRALFVQTASAQRTDALNIIVTKEASALAGLLGVSGGIPGLPAVAGTRSSAVVVFTDAHQIAAGAPLSAADLQFIGDTMAHEGGHWLGLWHTVERNGYTGNAFTRDALIETPECTPTADTNSNTFVEISECDGTNSFNAGSRNLMFWAGSSSFSQPDLTGEQGWLLRRHPLVY